MTENTVGVAVSLQVTTIDAGTDAGYDYIRLVDADTGTARYETGAGIEAGRYIFSSSNVAAGRYRLIAGTDLDQDSAVDDAGDITGAYPSLDSPTTITVDGELNGLEFITTFNLQNSSSETTKSRRDGRLRR